MVTVSAGAAAVAGALAAWASGAAAAAYTQAVWASTLAGCAGGPIFLCTLRRGAPSSSAAGRRRGKQMDAKPEGVGIFDERRSGDG